MRTRLNIVLFLVKLSYCVTLNFNYENRVPKTRIMEESPLEISCHLDDIITIYIPKVNIADTKYVLYSPDGNARDLDNEKTKTKTQKHMKLIRNIPDDIWNINIRKIEEISGNDTEFSKLDGDMYDFNIGPASSADIGNWILSEFHNDLDHEWIENFRSISILVTEDIASKNQTLREGENFTASFPYPIRHLVSCQLFPPNTTFDRYYERDKGKMDFCGYLVENVEADDKGTWEIIGVGDIIYKTSVNLNILSKV